MRQDLAERLRMVYTGDDGQEVFVSHAWSRLFEIQAPLAREFLLEFFSTCRIGDEMGLDVAGTPCFQLGGARRSMTWTQFILALGLHTVEEMVEISSGRDFLRGAPLYTYIRDPVQRLCHRLITYSISGRWQAPEKVNVTDLFYLRNMDRGAANVSYLLAQYLFRHAEGRKSSARLSGGHFIGHLAHHFGLVSDDGLRGLSVVTHEIPLIGMRELVAAASTPEAAEDAPIADEGAPADPAPVHAPPPPPPSPAAAKTMPQRLGRLEEEIQGLRHKARSRLIRRSMGPFGGAHQQYSRDVLERGLEMIASPSVPAGLDPLFLYLILLVSICEPSPLSKSGAELRRGSVYKSVEAKAVDLAERKEIDNVGGESTI
ncbi:hypothetical protein Tco_0093636 [Tanacetum coccineum]